MVDDEYDEVSSRCPLSWNMCLRTSQWLVDSSLRGFIKKWWYTFYFLHFFTFYFHRGLEVFHHKRS